MTTEESLLVCFYDWCMKTVDREIGRKFDTLSRLSSSLSAEYVEFISSRGDRTSARAVALALVKRFHLPALSLKGEELAYADQHVIEEFINFVRFKRMGARVPVSLTNARKEIRKRDLSSILKSVLDPSLGKPEVLQGGVWKYETVKEPFRVLTYIDIGGRLPLRYSHKVIGQNGILCQTSLLHWHGIATETTWDLMRPKDAENSVELLADLCKRFLTAMESIRVGCSRATVQGTL